MNIDYSDESTQIMAIEDDHDHLRDNCERVAIEREAKHDYDPTPILTMNATPTLNWDLILDWCLLLIVSGSFVLTMMLCGICIQAWLELEGSGLIACGVCAVLSAAVCGVAGSVTVKRELK
jgi:hypothetical protein